ncbi:MAG: reverse transcriptase domain-containing protein, partial [Candidatus Acidiferrales bacterium]
MQSKKLQNLLNSKNKNKIVIQQSNVEPKFHDRLVNLSDVLFSTTEINLLEKGPKYNPPNQKINLETIVAEIEVSLPNNQTSNLPKEQIKNIIKKSELFTSLPPKETSITSLQQKIKDNNLSVTRADKGSSIVILENNHYINKVKDFLEKEKPIKLKNNPTDKIQNKLKNTLKEVNVIFNEKEKYMLINKNPSPPILYGLVKIHKDGAPIRPVVSYTNTPLRNVAVKLNKIFKDTTQFKPKFSVKNSIELTQKLKSKTIPNNSILASFDVTNMFSNIPNDDCINIINQILFKKNINPIIQQEILLMLDLCINENYFQFNNEYYQQKDGLAMGSPLSPLLAEIFMSHFEENFLNTPHAQNICFWFRYVDDILVCFNGSAEDLQLTLNHLNSIHPKIKFTLEIEQNNKINFLDVTINKFNNNLKFDIYRKPTFSDTTIPKDSLHPMSHKLAAYRSMIHRAFSIPLDKNNLEKELNIIRSIGTNNGYSTHEINKLIFKKRKLLTINQIYPKIKNNDQKYTTLTYFGPISDKIANVIKNNESRKIAFRPSQRLSNMIFNVKDKSNKYKKSGVYR